MIMDMTHKEIIRLLECDDFSSIYAQADALRNNTVGDVIHIRALLEFSNYCKRQCTYCGLRRENTHLERFRMTPDEIVLGAKTAADVGYKTIVLQSGEDPWFTAQRLGAIVKQINQFGMVITLSCGEMTDEDYEYLKKCGVTRYLLKHETADETLYKKLHPCGSLADRIHCLKTLKALGYETGSGFMIGLPGQTTDIIARDLLLLKEIDCDMAGIGPFVPNPDTPLGDFKSGSTELSKRTVALARLLLPHCNLPATTALGILSPEEKHDVFNCGANVIMERVTPDAYRSLYKIYPSPTLPAAIQARRRAIEGFVEELGRKYQ